MNGIILYLTFDPGDIFPLTVECLSLFVTVKIVYAPMASLTHGPEHVPKLLFSLFYDDIKISSAMFNVKCYQAQVNVHGSIVYKQKCNCIQLEVIEYSL